MRSQIIETVTFEIKLGKPVALSDIKNYKCELLIHGVYFLHEGNLEITTFNPCAGTIVYIGKAIGETVYSRCRKHYDALRGNKNMRPGRKFREYRDSIVGLPLNLWIIPGIMSTNEPYLVSCAEEYLLHKYAQYHGGELPRANTK